MNLSALRQRLQRRLRQPTGLSVIACLILAVALAGMPSGQIHAHAGGDHPHDHAHVHDGHHHPLAVEDHGEDPGQPAEAVLHVHDTGAALTAIPMPPASDLPSLPPTAPPASWAAPPATPASPAPPYRPPIA